MINIVVVIFFQHIMMLNNSWQNNNPSGLDPLLSDADYLQCLSLPMYIQHECSYGTITEEFPMRLMLKWLNIIIQFTKSQTWHLIWSAFLYPDAADEQEVSCDNEDGLTEGLTDNEPFSSPKTSAFTLLGRSIMRQSYIIALIIMMVTLLIVFDFVALFSLLVFFFFLFYMDIMMFFCFSNLTLWHHWLVSGNSSFCKQINGPHLPIF